jgi:hypothetical protein
VSDRPPDAAALVGVLERHGVRFVVVGGQAAVLRGARFLTKDVDICPAWDRENLGRLAAALVELGAQLIGPDGRPLRAGAPSARLISQMDVSTWETPAGGVDVLLGIPRDKRWNLVRYEELDQRAKTVEVEGRAVRMASLEDVIRSKEVANRPADREVLPELQQLLDAERRAAKPALRHEGPGPRRRKPPRAGL